jgi:hypothetical protein
MKKLINVLSVVAVMGSGAACMQHSLGTNKDSSASASAGTTTLPTTDKCQREMATAEYKDRIFAENKLWQQPQRTREQCKVKFLEIGGKKMVQFAPKSVDIEVDNGTLWTAPRTSAVAVNDENIKNGKALTLSWDLFQANPDNQLFDPAFIEYTYAGKDAQGKHVELTVQFLNPQRAELCNTSTDSITNTEKLHLRHFHGKFTDLNDVKTYDCFDLPQR